MQGLQCSAGVTHVCRQLPCLCMSMLAAGDTVRRVESTVDSTHPTVEPCDKCDKRINTHSSCRVQFPGSSCHKAHLMNPQSAGRADFCAGSCEPCAPAAAAAVGSTLPRSTLRRLYVAAALAAATASFCLALVLLALLGWGFSSLYSSRRDSGAHTDLGRWYPYSSDEGFNSSIQL